MADLKRVVAKVDGTVTFSEKRVWEGVEKGYSSDIRITRADGKEYVLTVSGEKPLPKGPVKGLEVEFAYQYAKAIV